MWLWVTTFSENIIYIGLITQFCLLCNTSNKCADNSNKRVISTINHTLYIHRKHDIDNRYRTDIHKPTSNRYISPISTRYRLSDINTISAVDWPSSSRYTFTHRTDIGHCKNEIRPILKSDEMISARYRLDIECVMGI